MIVKTTEKDQANFAAFYGAVHFAVEQAEAMCDDKGILKPVTQDQIEQLKKTCREAVCAANGITATHDGQPAK